MPFEIERKFLVKKELLPALDEGIVLKQAYLSVAPDPTVRVRLFGEKAFLTIKSHARGFSRQEFEYEIPYIEAISMLDLAISNPVEKVRKYYFLDGKKWEIDFFEGANKGLILAEIELEREDEHIVLPVWIGKEVSHDNRYFNSQLALFPFNRW